MVTAPSYAANDLDLPPADADAKQQLFLPGAGAQIVGNAVVCQPNGPQAVAASGELAHPNGRAHASPLLHARLPTVPPDASWLQAFNLHSP